MIEWIVAKLALQVGEKWAKPLFYLLAVLLAVAFFFGAKAIYDHGVIAKHDAKVDARNAVVIGKANEHAVDQKPKDDARIAQESNDLERIANAKVDAESVAAQRRAFRDCVRWQQSAREYGQPTPGCTAGLARSQAR